MRLVGIVMMACLVFVFSGYESKAEEKPYAGTTLNWAIFHASTSDAYAALVPKIEKEMGVKVNFAWYTVDELTRKIMLDYAAGVKTWDILYVGLRDIGPFYSRGILTPIGKYLNDPSIADPDFNFQDYLPLAREEFVSGGVKGPKGEILGFPVEVCNVGIAYRTDLFNNPIEKRAFKEQYGYELKPPETYQQFYDIAKFFTRKKGQKLAGEVLDKDFYGISHSLKPGNFFFHDYYGYMKAFGADIYDPQTMMPEWNSTENINAMKFLISLKPFMPPGVESMTSGHSCGLFASGEVAMVLEFTERVLYTALDPEGSNIIGKFGFAPSPSVPGSGRPNAAFAYTNLIGIYSLSENKEAAYKFLERLCSKEIEKQILLKHHTLVWRRSLLEDPEIQEQFPQTRDVIKLFGEGMYLFAYPPIPEFEQVLDIINPSLSEAFTGLKSVEDSFNEAQKELVNLFKRSGYIE